MPYKFLPMHACYHFKIAYFKMISHANFTKFFSSKPKVRDQKCISISLRYKGISFLYTNHTGNYFKKEFCKISHSGNGSQRHVEQGVYHNFICNCVPGASSFSC